eukprot:2235222-Rhodomonas_salina.2
MDDFRIYDGVLLAHEVEALYGMGQNVMGCGNVTTTTPGPVTTTPVPIECQAHAMTPLGDFTDCQCDVGFTGPPNTCAGCTAGTYKDVTGSQLRRVDAGRRRAHRAQLGASRPSRTRQRVFCAHQTHSRSVDVDVPSRRPMTRMRMLMPSMGNVDIDVRAMLMCVCKAKART